MVKNFLKRMKRIKRKKSSFKRNYKKKINKKRRKSSFKRTRRKK